MTARSEGPLHIVNMEVYALAAETSETNKLATAVIGKHGTAWEAEQMIEQINREEFPEQPRIEGLRKCLSDFYGKTRILAFVYTKEAA